MILVFCREHKKAAYSAAFIYVFNHILLKMAQDSNKS